MRKHAVAVSEVRLAKRRTDRALGALTLGRRSTAGRRYNRRLGSLDLGKSPAIATRQPDRAI